VGSLKERYHLENSGVGGRIILKGVVTNRKVLTGLFWFRIGTGGGRLRTR
jgi:hypothetical protein